MYQLFIEIQTSSAFIYIADKKKRNDSNINFSPKQLKSKFPLLVSGHRYNGNGQHSQLLVDKLCYAGHKRKL